MESNSVELRTLEYYDWNETVKYICKKYDLTEDEFRIFWCKLVEWNNTINNGSIIYISFDLYEDAAKKDNNSEYVYTILNYFISEGLTNKYFHFFW
jgi:hypothetical protein